MVKYFILVDKLPIISIFSLFFILIYICYNSVMYDGFLFLKMKTLDGCVSDFTECIDTIVNKLSNIKFENKSNCEQLKYESLFITKCWHKFYDKCVTSWIEQSTCSK